MRLTHINCPQCNGQLFQQEDKFYCSSCGSAFNIDYEDSDVDYAKLITEPERTRLHLENNRILLEKNEELRRRFLIGEMKGTFVQEAKTAGMVYAGGAIYSAIISAIGIVAGIIVIAVLCVVVSKGIKAENARKEQAQSERFESLSAEDIKNDRNFLENAIAEGVACERSRRDDPIENKAEDGGAAYPVGSPVAERCYFLKDGDENHLCIIYRNTYEFSEDKSLKDVYECIFIDDLEPDETGHISFRSGTGINVANSGRDHHWDGYESADDAYEDVLLNEDFESFEIFEIDI